MEYGAQGRGFSRKILPRPTARDGRKVAKL